MDWLKTIFGADGGVGGVVKTVSDSVAQFIDTPEKKNAFELAVKQAQLEVQKLEFEATKSYIADTQSARELYKVDNGIQKTLALLFTACFFGLVGFLLFLMKDSELGQAQQNLIFTLFGAVSGIMVTIIGFYFGSSKGSNDKNEAMARLASPTK